MSHGPVPPFPDRTLEPAAVLLTAAGWGELLDRILRGICHDLNGRVTALFAVLQLIELGDPVPESLGSEAEKLEVLSSLLQSIPGRLESDPIPMLAQDATARALALWQRARGPERGTPPSLEVDPATPAILGHEPRTVRALALLLDAWSTTPVPGAPTIRIRGGDRSVLVHLPTEGHLPSTPGIDALRALLALDGGRLVEDAEGVALVLPSLEVARETERARGARHPEG